MEWNTEDRKEITMETQYLDEYIEEMDFEKLAMECAIWKQKYYFSKAEQQQIKKEELQKEKQLQELQKQILLLTYEKQYLLMGYDEILAQEAALALYNCDTSKVLEKQETFIQNVIR